MKNLISILVLLGLTACAKGELFSQDHSDEPYLTPTYVQQNFLKTNINLTTLTDEGMSGGMHVYSHTAEPLCTVYVIGGQAYTENTYADCYAP